MTDQQQTEKPLPNRRERKVIDYSDGGGRIEMGHQVGLSGAALNAVIAKCKRMGWVSDDDYPTEAGLAAALEAVRRERAEATHD
jgi:hypothetical protein